MFIVLFTATSYHCNAKISKKRLNLGVGFYLDKGAFFEASQNKNPTPLGSFPGNPCTLRIKPMNLKFLAFEIVPIVNREERLEKCF